MNTRKITLLIVAALALMAVAGTKISQLTRTRSLQETSRFLVSTQDATTGRWSSRYITAPDLATNLGPWITNSGGGGGSYTLPSYVLTNGETKGVRFTGRVTNDNVIQLNEDITQADGYNADFSLLSAKTVDINGTNVVQQIGNLVGSTNGLNTKITVTSNDLYAAIIAGGITAVTATNIATYVSGSKQHGTAALTNWNTAITTNVFVAPTDNLATTLSNAANGTRFLLLPGNHQITSRFIFSNSLGQAGVNIFNKTNIAITAAVPGTARIFTTNIGDMFYITNCSQVTIEGLDIEGWVVTNYASSTLYAEPGVVWGAINLYNCREVDIQRNRIYNHHDHGIQGTGANINYNDATTNNIRIRWNWFDNIGSARTNAGISIDGTATVPDAGWVIEGNWFQNCLRAIEPYSDNDSNVRPWTGTQIRGNTFLNIIDSAILSAGSTNANEVVIEGNVFIRHVGYTRRGTNFIPSSAAVDFNGGYGWKTHGNLIVGEWGRGIYYWNGTKFGEIKDNTLIGITNSGSGTGVPIDLQVGYQHVVENNTIRWSEGQGIYAYGLRDSSVKNNTIIEPFSEVGIQIATFGSQVSSNITFTGNRIQGADTKFWDQGLSGSLSIRLYGNEGTGSIDFTQISAEEITWDTTGGTNQVATKGNLNVASNALYTVISSGAGGTNNPVTLSAGTLAVIASQTARYYTNSSGSFPFSFSGTPNASARISYAVSNSAASTIYITNSSGVYDPRDAAFVTTLAIPAQSQSTFFFRRNATSGWELESVIEKPLGFVAGMNTTLSTNSGNVSIVGAFSFSTNGSSWIQATNIVFRTPANTVLSNDAAGTISLHINASSGSGGPTTNAPPQTLAINGGTGSTNVVIDFRALGPTNSVRFTLTANAGIVITNVIDGKELTVEVVQDSTGNRTIAQSSVGGAPLRFGSGPSGDVTGFALSTNGTYIDKIRLHGSGTNAQVVGMLRGYTP